MDKRQHNDGSELQDHLAGALKSFCEKHPAYWHRFPDTKSARGTYLSAQPGDYLFLVRGQGILIECKSTVAQTDLISLAWHGAVGKRQIAKHRLWHRSGNPSLYLYGDLKHKTCIWYSGKDVVEKRKSPLVTATLSELAASLPTLLEHI